MGDTDKRKQRGRAVKEEASKPVLLWIGDAVAQTGFARVTHSILDQLYKKYEVHVLGINYYGDPHPYPYRIYPAPIGGDVYGINRLPALIKSIKPHLIVVLNDPWIATDYKEALKTPVHVTEDGKELYSHRVLYTPVDGMHIPRHFAEGLNMFDRVIAYTEFGKSELQKSGTTVPMDIIPHGIDTTIFFPMDKTIARKNLGLDPDWYIVGAVARNQPRKALDRTFRYFAEWAKDKPENVKLYYHGAVQDIGWNLLDMVDCYGIDHRLIITSTTLSPSNMPPVQMLNLVYNSFDVQLSTAYGEGWGLPVMEGMACSIPQIVGDWSALGEWPKGAVIQVECTDTIMHTGGINTIGGIVDKAKTLEALELLYSNKGRRFSLGTSGLRLVQQPKYSWKAIADQFDTVFTEVLNGTNITDSQ